MGTLTREWEAGFQTNPVYVIAEAGINHNGSFQEAIRLIGMAKYAGANAVKFQTYSADLICRKDNPEYEMLKRCELPRETFIALQRECRMIGIDFISTPHDIPSAVFLSGLGMPYMKIGSGQSTDEFISQIPGTTALIVSLGMGKMPLSDPRIICQMHCISSYPCLPQDANMIRMRRHPINGFSDHTEGDMAAIMAVAMGAKFIEKHVTMHHNQAGPDHAMSANPYEFQEYVRSIRQAESMMGLYPQVALACEQKTIDQLKARK